MSTGVKAKSATKATEPLSGCELWAPINRLESALDVMNEDMNELCGGGVDDDVGKYLRNRIHNMLGVAQMLAGELAEATGVR